MGNKLNCKKVDDKHEFLLRIVSDFKTQQDNGHVEFKGNFAFHAMEGGRRTRQN